MKELSLNILDICENSVKAGASLTEILLNEEGNKLTLSINDDGCGMSEDILKGVTDPFYTTRTTRKVGMGLPLLKLAAEQTGGKLEIVSSTGEKDHGTRVTAVFFTDHIDFTPLGDVISSVTTLIQGHPDTDFLFIHTKNGKNVNIDTREIRTAIGDVPINSYEILEWIKDSMREEYEEIK